MKSIVNRAQGHDGFDEDRLALAGGQAAFGDVQGRPQPKVGIEEFVSLAQRFGFSQQAMDRIRAAVNDEKLGNGPHLGRYYGSAKPSMGDIFESKAASYFGVRHAYATCNGTCALAAGLKAVGVGPGDEVVVPATGFIATGLAAASLGAEVVFCDVDTSLQMDPDRLEAAITSKTRAVVPTHHWGYVADMAPIMEIAKRHGLAVVEDCAQSPGATYHGKAVGTIGDVGCFSISSDKLIGGGEGGLVVTDDDRLFDRVRQAAEAGGLWREKRFAPPRYDGELFPGGNFRMSELESAVNVVQIDKLPGVVERYRRVFAELSSRLSNYEQIVWQKSNDPAGDVPYLLRFFPESDELGKHLAEAMTAEGLPAKFKGGRDAAPDWHVCSYYFPLIQDDRLEQVAETCPVACDLYDRSIWIGIDQWWTDEDARRAGHAIEKVLSACCSKVNQASQPQRVAAGTKVNL